jgi:hypothetical protein
VTEFKYLGMTALKERHVHAETKSRINSFHTLVFCTVFLFFIRLKQQYPAVFQDVCLYSEVSHRMGSATYRLSARRFLQELFLDLQFDAVSNGFQTPTPDIFKLIF